MPPPLDRSMQNRRKQYFLETIHRFRTALGLCQKVCTLQRRNDKRGDLLAFEVLAQFAGFHGSLQTIGDRVANLGEYLQQFGSDRLAMVGCLGCEIAEEAAVSHALLIQAISASVDIVGKPLKRWMRIVSKRVADDGLAP